MSSFNITPAEYQRNNHALRMHNINLLMKGVPEPFDTVGLRDIFPSKDEGRLRSKPAPKPPADLPPTATEAELVPPEDQPFQELYTKIIDTGLGFDGVQLKPHTTPNVVVVGAGCGGLSAAFELKRGGANVVLLESSERVGGRIKTYGPGTFAPPLHCEGGAMRIPGNNWLTLEYVKLFGLESQLEKFEQTSRVIYIRALGRPLPYHVFEQKLKEKDDELLRLFPGLKDSEKGRTIDELWNEALEPVHEVFFRTYSRTKDVSAAYNAVNALFDKYTLKTFFEEVAGWSADAIRLYTLGHAIVVLDNGFMEVWKDEFLNSPKAGEKAEMKTLKGGMEQLTEAFLFHETPYGKLENDIRFGARVSRVDFDESKALSSHDRVTIHYYDMTGTAHQLSADFVIFAVPYTSMRLIEINPPFDPAKSTAINQTRYVNVTKILLQFKKRWWEKWLVDNGMIPPEDAGSQGGGLVTDLPIRHVMFPNHQFDMFKGTERGVVMVAYTFQQDADILSALPPADVIRTAKRNLAQIVGDEKLIEDNFELGVVHSWGSDQAGGGSAFVFFGANQKTQLHDDICRPQWVVPNSDGKEFAAHFAGEHASFSHAWIQGAFESAVRSAHLIYQSCASA